MTAVGRVVVLNGVSSSGKSTIVDAFCARRAARGELWVRTGIDDFIARLPAELVEVPGQRGEHSASGLRIVETDGGVRVVAGATARRLFAAYHRTAATWARAGLDVIVDECAFDREEADDWTAALEGIDALWVAIHCAVEVAVQREHARGDRVVGLAAGQLPVVHAHRTHDAEIDTTSASPDECVAALERAIASYTPFGAAPTRASTP